MAGRIRLKKVLPKWSNACRKVMCFSSEDDVAGSFFDGKLTWFFHICRKEFLDVVSNNCTAVVAELDHIVWIRSFLGIYDHVNEGFLMQNSIHNHFPL